MAYGSSMRGGVGLTRRRLLQVTGGGLVTTAALGAPGLRGRAAAEPYETFTWISPRGTLEVLDDYAYWSASKMGYFEDLEPELEIVPGPSDGTATVKFVSVGRADMGFPSPGVFSFAIEKDMNLTSVFDEGVLDTFSFAFRKGEGVKDLSELEGGTILLGSAAWQSIADPILAAQGVDISRINYIEAGVPAWGAALKQGRGDAALSWEGLRAEWVASGLDFDYWLGVQNSKFPGNSFVVRNADLEDSDRRAFLKKYLRGWAMGLEFAYHNPRAAVEIVFDQFPTLAENLGPKIGTRSILQQLHVFRGNMDDRQGWGAHDMESWQAYFDTLADIGQISEPVDAQDVLTNDFIGPANDFDHAKVREDAESYELSKEMAAVDIEKLRQGLYDAAI